MNDTNRFRMKQDATESFYDGLPRPEYPFATEEQRCDPSFLKDSVGHILDWGDEMTCICCGAVGIVHPMTRKQVEWGEGWDYDGSQWVRTPRWVRKLRELAQETGEQK